MKKEKYTQTFPHPPHISTPPAWEGSPTVTLFNPFLSQWSKGETWQRASSTVASSETHSGLFITSHMRVCVLFFFPCGNLLMFFCDWPACRVRKCSSSRSFTKGWRMAEELKIKLKLQIWDLTKVTNFKNWHSYHLRPDSLKTWLHMLMCIG